MNEVVRSLQFDQHDILRDICALHCPDGFECDASYGNGNFYRHMKRPEHRFDIDPQVAGVSKASSINLPLHAGSVGSLVFDPPFLTYVQKGRSHKAGSVRMTARFGGYYTYGELRDHYGDSIKEFSRVIRKGGVLVFKCQDIVHNHRLHCTHAMVIGMCESAGFRLLDLYVLGAKHRMPGPQKGTQRHARIFHSYFLVFKKLEVSRD